MRLCDKCLENNWSFRYIDGYIIATCNICEYEVEFKSRKLKRQETVDNSYFRSMLYLKNDNTDKEK